MKLFGKLTAGATSLVGLSPCYGPCYQHLASAFLAVESHRLRYDGRPTHQSDSMYVPFITLSCCACTEITKVTIQTGLITGAV